MTYFILLFLVLFVVSNWNYKVSNQLYCGIWGYVGSEMPDMWKFKLLGLYNQNRGKHSCGVSIDNKIMYGIGLEKEFADFIVKHELPFPVENTTVLGHTRHATFGAHTEKNAHPFRINDRLIGVHNGTIENIRDLATKYEVDITGIDVDSQMLYKIIDERGYGVLNDYRGFAALMWIQLDEPNVLYAYHGASRDTANGPIYIERPLHYYDVGNGVYFSSEADPLKVIQPSRKDPEGKDRGPVTFPHNRVIRIDYTIAGQPPVVTTVYQVDRENNNIGIHIKQPYLPPANKTVYPPTNNSFPKANTKNTENGTGTSSTKSYSPKNNKPYFSPDDLQDENGFIIYSSGRYSCKSKFVNGIFRATEVGTVPRADQRSAPGHHTYYFYRGVMIPNHDIYQQICHRKKLQKKLNNTTTFARVISQYSKYPVMTLPSETNILEDQEVWYWEGKVYPYLNFSPLFTSHNLEIHNGVNRNLSAVSNNSYNTGSVTDFVFTSPEIDDYNYDADEDGFLIDLACLEDTYLSIHEASAQIPDDALDFIEGYIREAYFKGNEDIPSVDILEKFAELLQEGCDAGKTLKDSIEHKEFEVYVYYDLIVDQLRKLTLMDEDEEDVEEDEEETEDVEDVSFEDLPAPRSASTDIANKIEEFNKEDEEDMETPEELLMNGLEDVVSIIQSMALAVKDFEKINHSEAAEMTVIVLAHAQAFKTDMHRFLNERGRGDLAIELEEKFEGKTKKDKEVILVD